MIIDATNLKLGRVCTVAAKKALQGESVDIVNCEQAVITGNKPQVLAKYQNRDEKGNPHWGPYQPKMADQFVKRTIRGMVPYKTNRGRNALKSIKCYIGNPENKDAETIQAADVSNSKTLRYVTVKEICALLGGKSS